MPYSTTWERHGVIWTYWGVVSGEDILRSNQEIYGDERFDRMTFQIVDLTRVERFDVSHDDMLVMAANDRAAALTNPRVKVAVVTTSEVTRQLSLVYELENRSSSWEQRTFATVAEARAWACPSARTKR